MSSEIMVTIDREECIECGVCYSLCPDVFEPGDDGWSQIVEAYRVDDDPAKGKVPADLESCVEDAADACPVAIIHVGE
ncbi:MAG: ferredoxin [Anaerolineae bacterium]